MDKASFYRKYAPMAKEAERKSGVPYLSALAQCALETGWGEHTPGNMCFGIKADKGWKGMRQMLWTTEVVNGVRVRKQCEFRKYASEAESFADYGMFLRGNRRYAEAFRAVPDAFAFSRAVAKAGYATDPNYYGKVEKVIRQLLVISD